LIADCPVNAAEPPAAASYASNLLPGLIVLSVRDGMHRRPARNVLFSTGDWDSLGGKRGRGCNRGSMVNTSQRSAGDRSAPTCLRERSARPPKSASRGKPTGGLITSASPGPGLTAAAVPRLHHGFWWRGRNLSTFCVPSGAWQILPAGAKGLRRGPTANAALGFRTRFRAKSIATTRCEDGARALGRRVALRRGAAGLDMERRGLACYPAVHGSARPLDDYGLRLLFPAGALSLNTPVVCSHLGSRLLRFAPSCSGSGGRGRGLVVVIGCVAYVACGGLCVDLVLSCGCCGMVWDLVVYGVFFVVAQNRPEIEAMG